MSNWKTTTLGILSMVVVMAGILKAWLDGDPSTVPDWNLLVATLFAGGIGVAAKDAGN